jgi:serine protease Do
MRFLATASLGLVAFGAHLATAQKPGKRNPLTQLSGSIRQLTNRVSPAVVEIIVTGYAAVDNEKSQAATRISRQNSSGSGVIVDAAGYIMTNAHVVQGAVRVQVLIPEVSKPSGKVESTPVSRTRSIDAHVMGIDTESDLALIKTGESGLPSLRFGDSDRLRQGDLVFAIGSPMGLRNSVSMGVVSSSARAVSDDNPILYIQTDASINPGNSGGALVDTQGLLIGLNSFIVSRSGGNEGLGFAIPSNVVRNVYEQLKNKGKVSRGSIGLFVQDISPVMAKGLGLPLPQGVVVADVEPDGPGDIAGLKRRDIVLSLNTHAVETARQFDDDIYRRQNGETITLVIQRGDERRTVSARVKEQPAPWDPLASLASPEKNLIPRLGILCIEIDKDVARLLPGLRRSYGIIVAAKAAQSQAQLVDLQPGDIIQAVNNLPIAVLSSFQELIAGFKRGDAVVLQIERDGRLRYITFEME